MFRPREFSVVVVDEHRRGNSDLPAVIHAGGRNSAGFGFAKRGQQHGRQNRDDGNHHKQFDQGKSALSKIHNSNGN